MITFGDSSFQTQVGLALIVCKSSEKSGEIGQRGGLLGQEHRLCVHLASLAYHRESRNTAQQVFLAF